MVEMAILNDVTKCMGCRGCQVACKQWNELPAEETEFFSGPGYQNPADLSPRTWNLVKFSEWEENGRVSWAFRRQSCMHCSEAPCMDLCPVGAIGQTEEGFVVIDEDRCLGCRICHHACPFGVPQIDFRTGEATKCRFCIERVGNDLLPACVQSCSAGALEYGPRDELIARARAIAREDAEATIYGDTQLGGLHVIYVLPGDLETFDLPRHPQVGIGFDLVKWLLKPFGLLASAAFLCSQSKENGVQTPADDSKEGGA